MIKTNDTETEKKDICCCPFDPSLWRDGEGNDYKIIHWVDKTFVKDGTYCW